nr:hypothetical protein [Micromonospora sp. DSM 115978]
MRIKTIAGLGIAAAATAAFAAGGVAYASGGDAADAEPRMRIVQQDTGDPAGDKRDCPADADGQPAGADL